MTADEQALRNRVAGVSDRVEWLLSQVLVEREKVRGAERRERQMQERSQALEHRLYKALDIPVGAPLP